MYRSEAGVPRPTFYKKYITNSAESQSEYFGQSTVILLVSTDIYLDSSGNRFYRSKSDFIKKLFFWTICSDPIYRIKVYLTTMFY
ncbi:MAG: hypothetical protein K2O14_03795, partial [Oscillospiraceae bacterium]|nr:hypothetical protein [Oscillospiraceae bacterium]